MDTLAIERHVLGTVLTHGEGALERIEDLVPADLAALAHRDIFAACLRLRSEGLPIDYLTVGAELSGNSVAVDALRNLGGSESLAEIAGHATELRRLSTIRAMVRSAQAIVELGRALRKGAAATLDRIEQLVSALTTAAASRDASVVSIREVADEFIAVIDRVARGEPPPAKIETGISALDRLLGGGFEGGELDVVGGTTSSGKSSLVGQMAVHAATRHPPIPVAFVTSEMTHRQMLARMVAAEARIAVRTLLSPRQAAPYREEISRVGDFPIWFQRSFPPTAEQAAMTIRWLARREGARLAVIDYTQRLVSFDADSREQETARVIAMAKNLALELSIVVVACAQLNRQPTTRADPRPKITDFRDSGRIEQEADRVLLVYRPEQYGGDGSPEIIVAKARNGPCGEIAVRWESEACRYVDIEAEPGARIRA